MVRARGAITVQLALVAAAILGLAARGLGWTGTVSGKCPNETLSNEEVP